MVLLIYLLKHIFMMTGLKMKNQGKGKVATKSDNEESTDTTWKSDKEESVDLPSIPPIKDDEEVKEGKWLKIITPNKLLTRLPILLAQIKAGNSSYKVKNKIRQIICPLYQDKKITKNRYNILIKSL